MINSTLLLVAMIYLIGVLLSIFVILIISKKLELDVCLDSLIMSLGSWAFIVGLMIFVVPILFSNLLTWASDKVIIKRKK